MILSDVEIQAAIDSGRLVIDPEPLPRRKPIGGGHCPYDTHSVDLRLSPFISIPIAGTYSYDLSQPGLAKFIGDNSEEHVIHPRAPFRLERREFILGMTMEIIRLPIPIAGDTCLAARIEGKSSRARCGLLIHFTAPTVHPGWDGQLTLEMINLGPAPILLFAGMSIAQLIVEEVKGIPTSGASQFQRQKTPPGVAEPPGN